MNSVEYTQTVGIYMPTHNRVELLKIAIKSVLEQSYQNFHLVIVNDGSSDGTKEYLASLNDERISVIEHNKPMGACRSRNDAIAYLDTELVTGLDDDDVFLPHRLNDLLSVYHESFAFVCSGYFWDYGAHKKALFNADRDISLSDAFDLNQCSNQILVNRERILSVDGFDENIPALQDHDLWVRLIAKYGEAHRIGKPSYVVNDDHSLERISSVKNKLNAIAMFEQKHEKLMSKRNKENFAFYKAKINGDQYGFIDFLKSTQYGLVSLKSRQYISQYFKSASTLRLKYLQTGQFSRSFTWASFIQLLMPLLATGGPGASRVLLLSSCIFFLGASETSSFSSDFFILMLVNTAFSQCYGFFLLKNGYENSFNSVLKQSTYGLVLSGVVVAVLYYLGLVNELYYSLILMFILHIYYVYRYLNISQQSFFPIALAEVFISIICCFLPFVVSLYDLAFRELPYQIYIFASFVGLIVVFIFSSSPKSKEVNHIPFSRLKNISISTTASIFAVFILPASIKSIASAEIVSIVALTISCMSISMLIPRTYANKILRNLASANLSEANFVKYSRDYRKLIFLSALLGLLITISYLYLISEQFNLFTLLVPLGIGAILVCAQLGFISLTFLSLQGAEEQVAKMNLVVLFTTGLFTVPVLMGLLTEQVIIYVIVSVACSSFLIRNKLASNKTQVFLN